jgi:hypothetical protein
VDWVALASLRDGANYFLDYQSPANQVAGITLPSTLAGWFSAANFSQVENRTNLVFDSDLQTLIKASQRYTSGSVVCLLIGANLLTGSTGGSLIPDHWVGLTSPVTIDGAATTHLASLGSTVNNDAKLAASQIRFDVFTWGDPNRSVQQRRANLTVATVVDYFYGFVAAK